MTTATIKQTLILWSATHHTDGTLVQAGIGYITEMENLNLKKNNYSAKHPGNKLQIRKHINT